MGYNKTGLKKTIKEKIEKMANINQVPSARSVPVPAVSSACPGIFLCIQARHVGIHAHTGSHRQRNDDELQRINDRKRRQRRFGIFSHKKLSTMLYIA